MLHGIACVLGVILWGLARVGYAIADIIRALHGEPRLGRNPKAGPSQSRRSMIILPHGAICVYGPKPATGLEPATGRLQDGCSAC